MEQQFEKMMREGARGLEISLSNEQLEQFYQYYEMLIETNKVMNLTAITEMKDVVAKHFLDSLALVKATENLEDNIKVIDVGTGAGFPGIPLKIAFPNLNITLLDSLNKRVKFLNDVIQALSLKNISAIHGRAEDFGNDPNYRENYEFCVSRAVANLSTLSEYCLPFVKEGGFFFSYKSGDIEAETECAKRAIEKLGGAVEGIVKFLLIEADAERSFVMIKKVHSTPKRYPRKAGMPSKEPLN